VDEDDEVCCTIIPPVLLLLLSLFSDISIGITNIHNGKLITNTVNIVFRNLCNGFIYLGDFDPCNDDVGEIVTPPPDVGLYAVGNPTRPPPPDIVARFRTLLDLDDDDRENMV
jgi:hypothetical protein